MIGASVTMIAAIAVEFLVMAGLTRLFIRLDLPEYGEWGDPTERSVWLSNPRPEADRN